jgi:hypothetical protein
MFQNPKSGFRVKSEFEFRNPEFSPIFLLKFRILFVFIQ